MLVSMFAVFSSIILAQNYGLQINNVNVTDKNCNDLSVIEGVKGKVKYNPAGVSGGFRKSLIVKTNGREKRTSLYIDGSVIPRK